MATFKVDREGSTTIETPTDEFSALEKSSPTRDELLSLIREDEISIAWHLRDIDFHIRDFAPPKLSEELLREASQKALEEFDRLGIEYEELYHETYFHDSLGELAKHAKVYKIISLPEALEHGAAETEALLHPEMQEYFNNLNNRDFSLVIDTSLALGNVVGYCDYFKRMVVLGSATEAWHVFVHENQHVFFGLDYGEYYEGMVAGFIYGDGAFDHVSSEMLEKFPEEFEAMRKLVETGIPRAAANETLSVLCESDTFDNPFHSEHLYAFTYAFRHQLYGLAELARERPLNRFERASFDSLLKYFSFHRDPAVSKLVKRYSSNLFEAEITPIIPDRPNRSAGIRGPAVALGSGDLVRNKGLKVL